MQQSASSRGRLWRPRLPLLHLPLLRAPPGAQALGAEAQVPTTAPVVRLRAAQPVHPTTTEAEGI